MTWRRISGNSDRILDVLNCATQLGPYPSRGLPVGGKTLMFGGSTVTFPGDEGTLVSLADITTALTENVDGLRISRRACPNPPGQAAGTDLWFYLSLCSDDGFTLGKDGTANEHFGLSTEKDRVGRKPIATDNVKAVSRAATSEYEVILCGLDADIDEPGHG